LKEVVGRNYRNVARVADGRETRDGDDGKPGTIGIDVDTAETHLLRNILAIVDGKRVDPVLAEIGLQFHHQVR
jgi:hypothetical protein